MTLNDWLEGPVDGLLGDRDRPPAGPCGVCGSRAWWWRENGGGWVCGVCHPGPPVEAGESVADPPSPPTPLPQGRGETDGSGVWIEEKMIGGCGPYRYKRWREGGRLRSKYLGKVGEPTASPLQGGE